LAQWTVFAGAVRLSDAQAVLQVAPEVVDELAIQSLLSVEIRSGRTYYRMLQTVRSVVGPMSADTERRHLEYFSAAAEGMMIFVAAAVILFSSIERFLNPRPIENVGAGLAVCVTASVVNGLVAVVLLRAGARHRSITLAADGKHLMTDVWTSVGVVVGVLLVGVTGWERLDPVVAFAVGLNILVTGWGLIRSASAGLMDASLSAADDEVIRTVLGRFTSAEVSWHRLLTREAGNRRFMQFDLLVPGDWTVRRGHDLIEEITDALMTEFPDIEVLCHLEPVEDPRSYEDA